ncbi:ApbE-like lipoprotein [Thioploca ingrica]|uniref:FAD:protein FMN transferase n=1 Tax=Thioploca ingrica TaxID=40754 RepID=A0A090AIY6_9GAMM|nr:ApbE-like lipoprotein [Thioploca ingrica]
MYFRLFIWILVSGLGLTGCSQHNPLYEEGFYVFGTLVNVSIWGVPTEQARQAVDTIAHDFQSMHHRWHAWEPGPLVDLNKAIAAGQVWTVEDNSLIFLIKQSQLFSQQSEGLFNPAVGQLIRLWGFHRNEFPDDTPLPQSTTLATLIEQAPSMADIQIKGNQVSSRNRAVQLDFGAIAKGYAIDLGIKKLQQQGIHNAIINAGGNLKVMGKKGTEPWRIGIRDPSGQGVLAAVLVSGEESVVTSGNYERFREHKGVHYSHIIDPRNGMPVRGITSVTVIDPSGTRADAAATALTVAGLSDWHRIAQQMGIKYVMVVDESATVYMNPAMAKRIQFQTQQPPKVVLTDPL